MPAGTKPSTSTSSKWRYLFITLSILQIGGLAFAAFIMWQAFMQAEAGLAGSEYLALYVFLTIIPVVGLISLINLIGLPFYIRKHKPRGWKLALLGTSLAISAVLALYGAYMFYQLQIATPKDFENLPEEPASESIESPQHIEVEEAQPEPTIRKSTDANEDCLPQSFYNPEQNISIIQPWGAAESCP